MAFYNSFFVTAGFHHLKFWYLESLTYMQKSDEMMESKSADLSRIKGSKVFVGVVCCSQGVFAMAQDGMVYVYDGARKLIKWMNAKLGSGATCISIGKEHLYCGGYDGLLRVFGLKNLEHVLAFPRPPALG